MLPHAVDVSLVGVGDQVQGGIHRGQGEHTAVERLLREGVVAGIMLAWHHVHRDRGLRRDRDADFEITLLIKGSELASARSNHSPPADAPVHLTDTRPPRCRPGSSSSGIWA